ncbi:unnamed protein product [Tilletia controversa]|uniref:VOC domain-containing protein n=3 Tax=Tilletia TaxID=13289 RepID=A0A8X7MZ30_9BASI|nr:hypothetical protein CF336_g1547 [Tilletia laevis]KAE8205120.1 hypothetical protein CF328_g690 [Tilletia controversa]KAE8264316.1 hypothetical protein A4X03_0g1044 [Tilletia caries]KAE8207707.1 hypothetical protein CF335_g941 [Tilletia laevis]KAE8254085.1 hypothetical protein A4X06_0g1066 [Tilletia controversa]
MTKLRPNIGPLVHSERDRILFSAHVEAARTFIGSDAHYLPRSNNLRLPDGQNIATCIAPALPWPTPPATAAGSSRWLATVTGCQHGSASFDEDCDADDNHDHELDPISCTCGAAAANQKLAELAAETAAAAVAAAEAQAEAQAEADAAALETATTIQSDMAEMGTFIPGMSSDAASSSPGSSSSEGSAPGEFGAGAPVSPSTSVPSSKSPYVGPTKGLLPVTPGQSLPAAAGGRGRNVTRGRSLRQTPKGTQQCGGRLLQDPAEDHSPLPWAWEDDDVDDEEHPPTPRQPYRAPTTTHKALGSSTAFLAAIPCLFVNDIGSMLPFYKTILGFAVIGKPDISYAKLRRGDVTIYLRIPPLLPPGSEAPNPGKPGHRNIRPDLSGICEPLREKLHPTSTWVNVASVDALFHECLGRVQAAQVSLDTALHLAAMESYFPDVDEDRKRGRMGRILGRVENKPWGTREFSVQDADGNRITFQQEIRR